LLLYDSDSNSDSDGVVDIPLLLPCCHNPRRPHIDIFKSLSTHRNESRTAPSSHIPATSYPPTGRPTDQPVPLSYRVYRPTPTVRRWCAPWSPALNPTAVPFPDDDAPTRELERDLKSGEQAERANHWTDEATNEQGRHDCDHDTVTITADRDVSARFYNETTTDSSNGEPTSTTLLERHRPTYCCAYGDCHCALAPQQRPLVYIPPPHLPTRRPAPR
jgi:hypothetical protein